MGVRCPKCQHDNPHDTLFCGKCGTKFPSPESFEGTKTLESPTEELTRGSVFAGRYEIIEELGKGGMGRVYRVEDKKVHEEVALKLIKPEIAKDKKTIDRFRNELKIARKIRHKNVCAMYDLGEEKGRHYITMDYIPGQDLKGLIRQTGRLAISTAISIGKQVCEGLKEAHRLGVIHRDLKPNNIMIDKEGSVRIMDFGIARTVKEIGITGSGMMIGTPEYMSPEQVEGEEVDQVSDIYTLGIILYEMTTGTLPFKADTPFAVGIKHKSEAPRNPKELYPQISDDLSRLILKCMEKPQENRYQGVEEILGDLGKIEKGIPTTEKQAVKFKPDIEPPSEQKWEKSIAVLPFTNMSADPEQEYFCDGIAEEIINALTNVESLRVVARTSAFSFKGKNVNIRDIGKELNVESILEGSVRKAGNRLRIMAQLISVSDGYHIWSERFDRELDDVFAIQDEISLAIVGRLKVKLLKKEKAAIVKRHTEDQEAYNLYLKGRNFVQMMTEEGYQKGIDYLEQAIQKDPDFALPFALLAFSYFSRSYWGNLHPHDAYPQARELTKKALEIDSSLALAYATSGTIKTFYDWDFEGADRDFLQALELNPSSSDIYLPYSLLLSVTERRNDAIFYAKKGQELDPLSSIINSHLGQILYWAGRTDEAVEVLNMTLELNPTYFHAHYALAQIYNDKSMAEEALSEYEKAAEYSGGNPMAVMALSRIYLRIGRKLEADKLEKSLVQRSQSEYVPPLCFYFIHKLNRDFDQAAVWLDKACEERDSFLLFVLTHPQKRLRIPDHPLFNDILKKWGLKT
jgi:serine/threonine protein kinase/Tfp pilus assembly protein PilF